MCPGEEAIAAFAAGRLARDERDALEAHVDTCSACTELVALLAKLAPPADATTPDVANDGDALLAGQLGRYVLLSRLGAGGMGVVYAAYDPELDRRVALKLLRHAQPGVELRDEARAIAKLSHPNVVAVHDVGRDGETTFVAMELVDGITVREWLRERRTPAAILDAFVQAGRGLAAAHAVGLAHRDVKPSNVMIGRDGRARVLDFGLARAADDASGGGTPAYAAPEQARGDRADARADQYSLCVSAWEALAGERPKPDETGALDGVSDRVARALRRGLSTDPTARFTTLDELLEELAPPRRSRRPWIVAALVAIVALGGALAFAVTRATAAPTCAHAGDAIAAVWPRGDDLRKAFAATKLQYADTAAATAIRELDAWTGAWRVGAEASCRATAIEGVQPPAVHALRQACLDQLLERLRPIVALAVAADANVVAHADAMLLALPAPSRCDDAAALGAVVPPPEAARGEVAAVRATIAGLEAAMIAGRANSIGDDVARVVMRANATGYAPLRARAMFLAARLDSVRSHYAVSIGKLHEAAQLATAAHDLEALAEIWIYLVQSYGNDLRTVDQASLFDGYVAALLPQLPDRDGLTLQLEHARCQRNTSAASVAPVIVDCETAIRLATAAQRMPLASADRVRLGHFQRMGGNVKQAIATLQAAVAEANHVFGEQHPDTALAHYALGIAYAADKQSDAAIAELRTALAIRRAAFPGDSLQVAESLQGLGDVLGESGKTDESVRMLEDALAMLDRIGEGESAHATNSHILLGMSLDELHRSDDAVAHYLRAADIADRSLEHGEDGAALGLQLAADIEARSGHAPTALAHLERALRLRERGHSPPQQLGETQLRIAQLALDLHDPQRARAMGEAARASYVTAKATDEIATVDKFLARVK